MYLKITYGWFAEENRGKTEELDLALQECLGDLGFFQTNARFDMATGERRLDFDGRKRSPELPEMRQEKSAVLQKVLEMQRRAWFGVPLILRSNTI